MSELEKMVKMIDNAVRFNLNWEERLEADVEAFNYLENHPALVEGLLGYLQEQTASDDQKKWFFDYCLDQIRNGKNIPETVKPLAEEFYLTRTGSLKQRAGELIGLYSHK